MLPGMKWKYPIMFVVTFAIYALNSKMKWFDDDD